MASVQVLPNPVSSSRKQNLEAGKRRLEEFRKKKAEGRAKKVGSTGKAQSIDVNQYQKKSDTLRLSDSNGASTSERDGFSCNEPLAVVTTGKAEVFDLPHTTETGFSSGKNSSPLVNAKSFYSETFHNPKIDHSRLYGDSTRSESPYVNYSRLHEDNNGSFGNDRVREPAYNSPLDHYGAINSVCGTGDIARDDYQSSYFNKDKGGQYENSTKKYLAKEPDTSPVKKDTGLGSISRGSSATSYADSIQSNPNITEPVSKVEYMHGGLDFSGAAILEGRRKFSSSINHQSETDSAPGLSLESNYMNFSLDYKSSFNPVPLYPAIPETGNRRTRPSFLDSLNVNRVSSEFNSSLTDSKSEPFFSKSSLENPVSSASQQPCANTVTTKLLDNIVIPITLSTPESLIDSSHSGGNGGELPGQNSKDNFVEWKNESSLRKHDEDFAALEQHIEDLTQEKFSLRRALDSSQVLAESLAGENSSLTDSYNQQGAMVNQIKFDMERLQDEIRGQLLEIESIKIEYANAQLECSAADERAKILASEVIGLEEKALRLRSSELKLERQLENSSAEITSYKKKVSILEKERQDLQLTVGALQEEKKLLQSKLRKAFGGGKSIDAIKSPSVKDISTSTEDLGIEVSDLTPGEASGGNVMSGSSDMEMQDIASLLPSGGSDLSVSSAAIPAEQMRMIGNINYLISELALEKEELIRTLAFESSNSSNLKELNKELSRKLEAQTQRLELLTAQSMVNGNIQTRQSDTLIMQDSTSYTDEGDEVVERVLGWIMKLFPGGPSKRRTSKLL